MFVLSSYIISHYAGSYTSFVKERIFAPLNMSSTTFVPSEALCSGEMTHSWIQNSRRIPQWSGDDPVELEASPGGIISSVEDMVCCASSLIYP